MESQCIEPGLVGLGCRRIRHKRTHTRSVSILQRYIIPTCNSTCNAAKTCHAMIAIQPCSRSRFGMIWQGLTQKHIQYVSYTPTLVDPYTSIHYYRYYMSVPARDLRLPVHRPRTTDSLRTGIKSREKP